MKKLILVVAICLGANACDSTPGGSVVEALDAGVGVAFKPTFDAGVDIKGVEVGTKAMPDAGRSDTLSTLQGDVLPTESSIPMDAGSPLDTLATETRPGSDVLSSEVPNKGVFCEIPSPTGDKPSDRSTFVLVTNDPVQSCLDSIGGLEKWSAAGRNCSDPANDFAGGTGISWCLNLVDSLGFPCSHECLVAGIVKMPKMDPYSGAGRRTFPACTTDGKFAGWGCMKTDL